MTEKTQVNFGRIVTTGTQLNGIYEIDEPIAAGGMGEVYRGHAIQTGDPVAIKIIKAELASNESAMALFRKEASALHQLQHEAIVRYYVSSVDPVLKRPYLAMEYVSGLPLSEIIGKRTVSFEDLRKLQQRLASGLQAAHEKGIIHRDMSPDNVLLQDGDVGQAKIIDFGIARATKSKEATVIGDGFAGKYSWVSPEQLGLFNGTITGKSDIYSLGLVLAAAARGAALDMGGTQFEVIEKRRVMPKLDGVDRRFAPLIEWMLEPDPADRPASMAEVAAWTPELAAHSKQAPAQPAKKSPVALLAAAVAGIALVGGGTFFVMKPAPPPTPPSQAVQLPQVPPLPATPEAVALRTPPVQLPPEQPRGPRAVVPRLGEMLAAVGDDRPPAQLSSSDQRNRIQQYVRQFENGGCYFLNPVMVSDDQVDVEAFGLRGSFAPFQRDFVRTNGFEPRMKLNEVSNGQCATLDYLRLLGVETSATIKLEVRPDGVGSRGLVTGATDQAIEVFSVNADGQVKKLSQSLAREQNQHSFSPGVSERDGPRLLVALVSQRPLDAFLLAEDDLLGGLVSDIERTPQRLSVALLLSPRE